MCTSKTSSTNNFYAPMHFTQEPVTRLMLLAFHKKDPDTIYDGFEPQVLRDEESGEEILVVLGYRRDKYLDIFHQAGYQPNIDDYKKVHKGAKGAYVREFEDGYFRKNEGGGVELFLAFKDSADRDISIRVSSMPKKSVKAVQMLAPVGSSAVDPNEMMMVFMDSFYFVSASRGMISIVVDGKDYRMKKRSTLGGLLNSAKYCLNAMVLNMNPERNDELPLLQIVDGKAVDKDSTYQLRIEEGKVLTESISCQFPSQEMVCSFEPALPDIRCLEAGEQVEGAFTIDMGDQLGSVGGKYRYECMEDKQIKVQVNPTEGWKVGKNCNKTVFLLVSKFIKVFKAWPKSYQWDATLTPHDGGFKIASKWRRL